MKTIICTLLILSIMSIVQLNSKESKNLKAFACQLETLQGRVFESLLLGTDWKELTLASHKSDESNSNDEVIYSLKDNLFHFKLSDNIKGKIEIKVFNIYGNMIWYKQHNLNIGDNEISDVFPELVSGVYIISISSGKSIVKVFKGIY